MNKIIVLLLILSSACTVVKKPANDTYLVINSLTKSLLEGHRYDKDIKHLYFRKEGTNGHFISLLERNFRKYFSEEEYNQIFKVGDMAHLIGQLEQPFNLDYDQIASRKIKEYIKQEVQIDQGNGPSFREENLIGNDPMTYSISRPVFTLDNKWGLVYVINRSGISIDILQKSKKNWNFYRLVPIGIF